MIAYNDYENKPKYCKEQGVSKGNRSQKRDV
jgi:hypothetical protein